MRKNIDKKIQDTMEALNADGYIECEAWNGYSVYIPQYEGSPTIGLPSCGKIPNKERSKEEKWSA